ncbi:TIGR03619 family F420-dependent LLM class oxidoreductase [Streptantibioticus ferralitis]|uniref:TIGR03619 family F420-dependent LLM class oxidoreductase n=1 Tax=Streptantibioticus ferralitis TaxID=236510 RepID=A0ABT5YWW6_9ACTN|nr:TIGR03619 family F420-dependent LLM class oxidoreductase [Streptantibioticus ferralitis]MDF2255345.1 TIGR03619 family F420-dependent LLM class oxidoreductase [Streptantibioticus ferralitis]
MHVGIALPQNGRHAQEASAIAGFAREAERLGAASLWVGDRLLAPVRPTVGYMGTDTIPEEFRAVLDPFALLTAAAAVTESILVGSSVINITQYSPAVLARQLTTIDQLSGGRLIPGFGIGWSPEEYAAAGIPFASRGARLDESLDVLERWWSESPVEYQGKFWQVPASYVDVKPVQRPRPPIHLGAIGPTALRRVGRRADGWLPAVLLSDRVDPEPLIQARAVIDQAARDTGRDPSAIGSVPRLIATRPLSAADLATALRTLRDRAGIEHAFLHFPAADGPQQTLDTTGEVLELLKAG